MLVPEMDRVIYNLITDLEERGMLERTLVIAMGEFGRTPWMNQARGRDHYPHAWSLMLAGCGIKRGVVVGATQYEHGRDTAPAVAGVRELLDDACEVMPALGEYELAECAAGLRPMTPDNLPVVGRLDDRTLVAAGHGRSGFLLAPWTAATIAAELKVGVPA
jgi:glycine/D-amino acid oxidase-like deaminating enzyme